MKRLTYGLCLLPLALVGCGGDDDDVNVVTTQTYEVTVVNLTNNQPLGPTGVILHTDDYTPWSSGALASDGLEVLAESGSPADWLAEATDVLAQTNTDGVTAPGASTSVTLTISQSDTLYLTTASMLVNTNDAFTGVSGATIGDLNPGDSLRLRPNVYDAGTEANTETSASIPGPAANGEGFNSESENRVITIHPGVVSADDGLTTSALDESHRFDQGAQGITITRIN